MKDVSVRDKRGRLRGDLAAGPLPSGHATLSVRVSGSREAVRAFAELSPRERGAVISDWHASRGSLSG